MMRRSRTAIILSALFGVAGVLALSVPGTAQQPGVKNVELYTGGDPEAEGVKLGGWGSGSATEDRSVKGPGEQSIKIETSGFYSGARIQFVKPRELTDQKADPFGFLQFTIKFQPGRISQRSGSGGSGGPGPGGLPGPAGIGDMGLSGGGGFGPGGGGFGPGPAGSPESLAPDTRRMKIVLRATEGTFIATNFPVTLVGAQEEGWSVVAVPFVAFKGLEKSDTLKVEEIRLFGDSKDTFWVGEIRTTTDDEPINVDALDELEVAVGDPTEFVAAATGGISPLQYSWDFDLSDGIQEDATGPFVVHVFRNGSRPVPGQPNELQPYVVTLTVRDLSGAKRPVRRQTNIIVNP